MPRLKMLKYPSIVFVYAPPRTYSPIPVLYGEVVFELPAYGSIVARFVRHKPRIGLDLILQDRL
jgi:hypothetical protein